MRGGVSEKCILQPSQYYLNRWQPRWFVLDGGTLSYYDSQEEAWKGSKGSLQISACEIQVHSSDTKRVDLTVPGQQYFYLRALNAAERQRWLVAMGTAKACLTDNRTKIEKELQENAEALKAKMSELRLYCDLLCEQVGRIREEEPGTAMGDRGDMVRSTCSSFLRTLEECLLIASRSFSSDLQLRIPPQNPTVGTSTLHKVRGPAQPSPSQSEQRPEPNEAEGRGHSGSPAEATPSQHDETLPAEDHPAETTDTPSQDRQGPHGAEHVGEGVELVKGGMEQGEETEAEDKAISTMQDVCIIQTEGQQEVSPAKDEEQEVCPAQNEEQEVSPAQNEAQEVSPAQNEEQEASPAQCAEQEASPAQNEEQEVSPAQNEKQEVSPAQNEKQEVNPAQNEKQEVNPAQNEKQEVSPAQCAQQEVNPAQTEEQEVSPAQNEEKEVSLALNEEQEASPAQCAEQEASPAQNEEQDISPAQSVEQEVSPAQSEEQEGSLAQNEEQEVSPAQSVELEASPAQSVEHQEDIPKERHKVCPAHPEEEGEEEEQVDVSFSAVIQNNEDPPP
ncbi:pleckstrin homology domain-containing family A member 8-like isoform X4 [Anguilla anguilla]|uniref:pleckstrin homology domain-containing family A member 8-like isoform X4 n=1 Tax=Anguilla anguilla TaxID=7936 RepID=UPI0015AB3150|nr:pleckstrin homology domain-containing family A member 8-like isoform X4 [Anguilla anguilla]